MLTKDDVQKAIGRIGADIDSDDVNKGKSVPTDGDLNSSNGAADGGGSDNSLSAPGENMNDKYGNKKGKDASPAKKSLPSDFHSGMPSEVETKVDVSDFLKSLVDHTADRVNGLREFIVKSDEAAEARTDDIVDQVGEVQKSLMDVGIVLKAICEKIGVLENEPAHVAKSQTAATQGKGVERQFENNTQTATEGVAKSSGGGDFLYKSLEGRHPVEIKKAISCALMDLCKKGELDDLQVINFETYNVITPEADVKLRAVLN